ncbi:uncharacterized protein LOC127456668 [Myxocyprinus asiaticus]|uniref:uncharacterized protein LOC127456668 n=1 Tax=Myxocyprinus asiaticus TaxID=70543 RepID=UPI00222396AF|nr:uncharacterized protein LOC127456668 [Myxocyprinus asiaticus]
MEYSQFAEVLKSLAGLHHTHHQALLELRQDQDRRFHEILQVQAEDRHVIQSLLSQEKAPAETPDTAAPAALMKMGAEDDPEAFLDIFERTAEIWGWPRAQWAATLIPLLSGEAQLAAQQLPAASLLVYDDLRKTILQWVGRSPEQYRQLFRSMKLEGSGRPFAFIQRLRDACQKWLPAEDCDVEGVIDQVVLEQLIHRLPKGMAEWVQYHRPVSLEEAVQLAEDHLSAYQRAEEPSHSLSPPPMFSPISPPSTLLSPNSPSQYPGGVESRCRSRFPIRGGLFPSRGLHCLIALPLRWMYPPAQVWA